MAAGAARRGAVVLGGAASLALAGVWFGGYATPVFPQAPEAMAAAAMAPAAERGDPYAGFVPPSPVPALAAPPAAAVTPAVAPHPVGVELDRLERKVQADLAEARREEARAQEMRQTAASAESIPPPAPLAVPSPPAPTAEAGASAAPDKASARLTPEG